MSRLLALPASVCCVALALAAPAGAITSGGSLDGGRHPNVGALLTPAPGSYPFCSGTLVAPRVVLTASHCVDYGQQAHGIDGARVTFDEDTTSGSVTVLTGDYWLNPAYRSINLANDVSAIILEAPVPGIEPADLPAVGALDVLRRSGALRKAALTVVGYGTQQQTVTPPGPPGFPYLDQRWYAVGQFMKLDKNKLQMAQQQARGLAGACYGDSGGPTFLGAGDGEGDMVLGVTSTGDLPCLATNVVTRADTPNAVAFLQDVLEEAAGD